MPIRFKCPHCARTLATARRKSGSEIRCPLCGLPATVPPDDPPEPSGHAAGNGSVAVKPTPTRRAARPAADQPLFETDDVDAMLGPGSPLAFDLDDPPPATRPVVKPASGPDALSLGDDTGKVVLDRTTAVWLTAAALVAVVVAFVIGLKVGAAW